MHHADTNVEGDDHDIFSASPQRGFASHVPAFAPVRLHTTVTYVGYIRRLRTTVVYDGYRGLTVSPSQVLMHHAETNVEGDDPDITGDMVRFHNLTDWSPAHRFQVRPHPHGFVQGYLAHKNQPPQDHQ